MSAPAAMPSAVVARVPSSRWSAGRSTLGRILDLPADQRLEGTLATTALGIAAGADIVRVHDVRENVRVARVADAVVRGWAPTPEGTEERAR